MLRALLGDTVTEGLNEMRSIRGAIGTVSLALACAALLVIPAVSMASAGEITGKVTSAATKAALPGVEVCAFGNGDGFAEECTTTRQAARVSAGFPSGPTGAPGAAGVDLPDPDDKRSSTTKREDRMISARSSGAGGTLRTLGTSQPNYRVASGPRRGVVYFG